MLLKILNALLAIVAGVLGALILFWMLDKLSTLTGRKISERIRPYAYILPAAIAIGLFLIYPAIQTIVSSFANADTTKLVGGENYKNLAASSDFHQTLLNSLLWIIVVPLLTVIFGLAIAVLADRLKPSMEKLSKSLIFMPMAISMVGAATIWQFVYAAQPAGEPQIGLLNAIWTSFGNDPVGWLNISAGKLNSFLLMVVLIWTQVGYAMVLLSAAIKGVPDDTVEAGRIDGAGERQIFFRIVVPQIWPTIITVFVTVLIGTMKTFDIVYVTTQGGLGTNIIGVEIYKQLFTAQDNGMASAVVVVLMVAVIPVMIYQVRQFRRQEAAR